MKTVRLRDDMVLRLQLTSVHGLRAAGAGQVRPGVAGEPGR